MDAYEYIDASIKMVKQNNANGYYTSREFIEEKERLRGMVKEYRHLIDEEDADRFMRIIGRLRVKR